MRKLIESIFQIHLYDSRKETFSVLLKSVLIRIKKSEKFSKKYIL